MRHPSPSESPYIRVKIADCATNPSRARQLEVMELLPEGGVRWDAATVTDVRGGAAAVSLLTAAGRKRLAENVCCIIYTK